MSRSNAIVSAIAVAAVYFVGSLAVTPQAIAEISCDDPKIVDRLPKLPGGCQKERISASGNQRPSFFWARKSVEDHWQDQVINKYGERFAQPAKAACARQECGPSAIPGFTRCTLSGYPCATTPYLWDVIELNRAEVEELQQLLTRASFPCKVDGKFGEKTHSALQRWQRSRNLPDDGRPTMQNLERLRKG